MDVTPLLCGAPLPLCPHAPGTALWLPAGHAPLSPHGWPPQPKLSPGGGHNTVALNLIGRISLNTLLTAVLTMDVAITILYDILCSPNTHIYTYIYTVYVHIHTKMYGKQAPPLTSAGCLLAQEGGATAAPQLSISCATAFASSRAGREPITAEHFITANKTVKRAGLPSEPLPLPPLTTCSERNTRQRYIVLCDSSMRCCNAQEADRCDAILPGCNFAREL